MFPRIITYQDNRSFFLLGPRGTGKTTWVEAQFPSSQKIDLLDDAVFSQFVTHPNRLKNLLPKTKEDWTIIDEVQRVPEILNEVHRLIQKEHRKFILLGSSPRKLKKVGANLLAGRALLRYMYPLTVQELGSAFNLQHALKWGFLPEVWTEKNPKEYLQSYIGAYLREEIQQEALVRNVNLFAKFLEISTFSQAGVLNVQTVADDCGVDRKTAENYFQILEDLLIGSRIEVFRRKAKRKVVTQPKFFLFDVGVYKTLRPKGPLDLESEIEGPALETLVYQEIKAQIEYRRLDYKIYYWRTSQKEEVDLVLYGESGFIALEIKSTFRFRNSDLKALKLFLEDYPSAKAFFLYTGEENLTVDGIQVMNIEKFLLEAGAILAK